MTNSNNDNSALIFSFFLSITVGLSSCPLPILVRFLMIISKTLPEEFATDFENILVLFDSKLHMFISIFFMEKSCYPEEGGGTFPVKSVCQPVRRMAGYTAPLMEMVPPPKK